MSTRRGVFVTATGTEVGKTVISRLIVNRWTHSGDRVGYFKAVASGCEETPWGYRSPDEADIIEGTSLSPDDVTSSYRFEAPLSPDKAAEREDRSFDIDGILAAWRTFRDPYDTVVVEGIGGVAVPFNQSEDVAELAGRMNLPSVVVAPSSLGTISYTRTAIHYMRSVGCEPSGIVLTPEEGRDIERINRDHLRSLFPDLTVNLVPDVKTSSRVDVMDRMEDFLTGCDIT